MSNAAFPWLLAFSQTLLYLQFLECLFWIKNDTFLLRVFDMNQIALLQVWWSEASVQREKMFIYRSVKNLELLVRTFLKEAMVERLTFGILAPRPPRSADKSDVESNGLPVRQTPRGYNNLYSDIEYLIDLKPPLYINISVWKGRRIRNLQKKEGISKNCKTSILGQLDIISSAWLLTSRLIK